MKKLKKMLVRKKLKRDILLFLLKQKILTENTKKRIENVIEDIDKYLGLVVDELTLDELYKINLIKESLKYYVNGGSEGIEKYLRNETETTFKELVRGLE